MANKTWNLMYVVGNPAVSNRVISCADNPMVRSKALSAAQGIAANGGGWRVWVEHHKSGRRIFESPPEVVHKEAQQDKRVTEFARQNAPGHGVTPD